MNDLIDILDIIGVVAFAISGAMTAIKKRMDLLGICVLGIVTAVGGGITRDVLLGNTPPSAFKDPRDVSIAAIVSCLVFIFMVMNASEHSKNPSERFVALYEYILMLTDAVGLGAFTVIGIDVAKKTVSEYNTNTFLLIFVGVITGVGGGVMGVLPGQFGIAAFAPPLDGSGNSVKAQLAIEYIMNKLRLNVFGNNRITIVD